MANPFFRKALLQGLPAMALLALPIGGSWAHEGGFGNEVMWHACENKQVDDQCAFQNSDHDIYRGSCQSMADHLACVRNQPIERASLVENAHSHDQQAQRSANGNWLGWLAGTLAVLIVGSGLFIWSRR